MSVRDPDFVDYLAIAAEITGLDEESLSRVAHLYLGRLGTARAAGRLGPVSLGADLYEDQDPAALGS